MTSLVMFDKLRFVKGVRAIKSLKLTQKEAEDFAQVVESAMTEAVATKADIADLKAELKTEMANLKADIAKWFLLQWIATIGFIVAVLPLILN